MRNLDPILAEWESFARALTPGRHMRSTDLRDDLEAMLRAIAADIESPQSHEQQMDKSRGKAAAASEPSAAREHGLKRITHAFSLLETIAEFRALRASVIRLWLHSGPATLDDAQQLTRFNEAIDQALTESSAQAVAQLDRARNLFLGTISHDLRSPLQSLTMSVELLSRSTKLSPSESDVTRRIVEATGRMEAIVNQLISFTAMQLRPQMPLNPRPSDFAAIVNKCVEELRAIHPRRAVTVSTNGDTRGVWDAPRLAQLVVNVIGNALEHGSQQPDAAVELEIIGSDQRIDAWIINVGARIPAEDRASVFEPLRRGKDAPERKGSLGLGLYIARAIAESHGGTLALAASDDHQTVFHLSLPKQTAPGPDGPLGLR